MVEGWGSRESLACGDSWIDRAGGLRQLGTTYREGRLFGRYREGRLLGRSYREGRLLSRYREGRLLGDC